MPRSSPGWSTRRIGLAAGDPAGAVEQCDEALQMWRGTPYGEALDGELIATEVARLQDVQLTAREIRIDALLATGRHLLVTGELEMLVAAHPFRERLWELYALALYRCGRQADALAALRRAREVLVDELGIDPSSALRRLESDVLAQAPSLDVPSGAGARPARRDRGWCAHLGRRCPGRRRADGRP